MLATSCTNESKNKATSSDSEYSEKYSGPIIDMHIHGYTQNGGMFGLTHPTTLRGETYQGAKNIEEHQKQTISKFHEHNVVKAIVTDGHEWYQDNPDIVLIADADEPLDTLRKKHELGKLQAIAEMAPFYAGILADDPSQMKYFELAQELGIPVGFHIFPGGPNYGIHTLPEILGGMRTYNANPLQLEKALAKYPNLKLYIMHGGWPYIEDLKALMYAHPNVYVDIAVTNWILPQEEFNKYLKSLIDAGFGNRIMYGTDQMVWPQVISIGIETVNNADFLTRDQKEDIFFDNAAEFLELSEAEITKLKNP
ncbi:MAG: amidohydrolase family protein [Cyclobacteriaceae bacterium]|nr:amidohydrolase family protein [Cyclobacteriaceae bacterium]